MQSKAKTVEQYLAELPEERRQAIQAVRDVINKNLPAGYEEGMQYGMIGYYVPHSVYPPGYHTDPQQPLPFASLASQKNHLAIYLFCIYSAPEEATWFQEQWAKTGKKLDMGKSCVRFKKVEDLPLPLIGETVKRMPVKKFIQHYQTATAAFRKRKPAARRKPAAKRRPARKRQTRA
jgi:hypothetical protein